MLENPPGFTLAARLTPRQGSLVLGLLLVLAAALVWIALGITEPLKRAGPTDLDTYQRVVEALRSGRAYYAALHAALLDGGYGTLSPLNWRPPVFLTVVSWFPTLGTAQLFLEALTVGAWALAVAWLYRRNGPATAIAGAILLALSLLSIFADRAALSFELCAGMLILISVSTYGLGWRWAGFGVAVLALFVRELSGVYAVVCLVIALRERRWPEVIAWLLALLAYVVFYFWHWSQLSALLGPEDHAAATGWLQFGGLVFVLRTAAFNGVLLALPYWVAALVLVAGLVGLTRTPRAFATVVLYVLLFLFYGRPENNYWGALYAPLIAVGLASAPAVLVGIWQRVRLGFAPN